MGRYSSNAMDCWTSTVVSTFYVVFITRGYAAFCNIAKGAERGQSRCTKNARKKLQEKSNIHNWTAHDLRRTARTIMSRLNIDHHVRERVLNHAQGGIRGVYDMIICKSKRMHSKKASKWNWLYCLCKWGGKLGSLNLILPRYSIEFTMTLQYRGRIDLYKVHSPLWVNFLAARIHETFSNTLYGVNR